MEANILRERIESLIDVIRENKLNLRKAVDAYFSEEERVLRMPPELSMQALMTILIGTSNWRSSCLTVLFLARVWNKYKAGWQEEFEEFIVGAIKQGYEPDRRIDDGMTKEAKMLALAIIGDRQAIQHLEDEARHSGSKGWYEYSNQLLVRTIMTIASRQDY